MTEPGDNPDLSYDPPKKERPVGVIAAVITFVLLVVFALWIVREKKTDKVRQDVLAAMDQELTADEEAMKTQKEKLIEVSRQLETMKTMIQTGQAKGGKKAVDEYNKLAAQQRAERETFTLMADAYNKKVAEYRKLEQ